MKTLLFIVIGLLSTIANAQVQDVSWSTVPGPFFGSGYAVGMHNHQMYLFGGIRWQDIESSKLNGPTVLTDIKTCTSNGQNLNRGYLRGWIDNGYFYLLGGRDQFVAKETFYRLNLSNLYLEPLASMHQPRLSFCFATFDNPKQVIVVGGYAPNAQGYLNQHTDIKSVESYDLNTNTWTFMPDYPDGDITHCSAQAYGDWIYVFGGMFLQDANSISFARFHHTKVRRMNRFTGEWQDMGDMPPREGHATARIGNEVLILAGGYLPTPNFTPQQYAEAFKSEVFAYDLVTNQTRQLSTKMPMGTHDIDAVVDGNQVFVPLGETLLNPTFDNKTNIIQIGRIQ